MSLHKAAVTFLAAGIIASTLLVPAPASGADDATVEMARARFKEGVQFFDQKQYEKARLAFLQAYALKPHPAVLLNLAQSELRAGRPADAASHFSEYLKKNTDVTPAQKQEASTGLAAAKAKVGEIAVSAETGAHVLVDGDARGNAPLPGPLYLSPGNHSLEARSGDKKTTKTITVNAGQSLTVDLAAAGSGAPVPVAEPPGPAAPPKTEAPKETPAETEAPEAAPTAATSETAGVEVTPSSAKKDVISWFVSRPLAIAGTAVGVLGLGGGVTLAILSGREHSNANAVGEQIEQKWQTDNVPYLDAFPLAAGSAPCALNPEARRVLTPTTEGGTLNTTANPSVGTAQQFDTACSRFTTAADNGDKLETFAIVATSVGAAALIGTVVYYFVDTSGSSSASGSRKSGLRAQVVPILSPTLSGLSVTATF